METLDKEFLKKNELAKELCNPIEADSGHGTEFVV
jgi:hypothetical protein